MGATGAILNTAPPNCSSCDDCPLHLSAVLHETSFFFGTGSERLQWPHDFPDAEHSGTHPVTQHDFFGADSSSACSRAAGICSPCSSTNAIRSAFVVQQQPVQHSSADLQPQGRFMHGKGTERSLPPDVEPARTANGSGNCNSPSHTISRPEMTRRKRRTFMRSTKSFERFLRGSD